VHPVLTLGPWRVHAWGAANAAACVVLLLVSLACARLRGIAPTTLVRLWPWVILGGVTGAHLYWLVAGSDTPLAARSLGEILDVFSGSAIQGGFVGGGLVALLYLRVAGAPMLAVLDVLSPAGAAAQALTRVGCFLAGCCHGGAAPPWLGVVYTDPASLAPRSVPLHAAQLYESALLLVLAGWLFTLLRRRDVPRGRIFAAYLGGYGLIRFVVQFFRGDDADRLVLGLAHSQYAGLVMVLVAVVLWRWEPSARAVRR
jgi:phosphatidylglycerol:prolipoprotein diacylglycerol transferase